MRAQTSEDGVRRATAALSILTMLGLAACAPDTEEAEGAAEEDGQSAEETADGGQAQGPARTSPRTRRRPSNPSPTPCRGPSRER